MSPAALAALLLLLLLPLSAAAESVERVVLRPLEIEGCQGLGYPRGPRELLVDGERMVDSRARFWVLDRPASFHEGHARTVYRVGDGALAVDAELSPGLEEEIVRLTVERPIGERYRRAYLDGVALPCERRARYAVVERGRADADLYAQERFDRLLHEANELLYDDRFAEANERLRGAAQLRPDDPAPWWMLARSRYLELEHPGTALPEPARLDGYAEVERYADEAVARAPERAEGYLWRGVARGRIATSLGNIRIALQGALGGRGPAWIEAELRQAVSRQPEYQFFGFSTRADALHALAQFYRFAPDAWYMGAVGTRGDIGRAIELSREAVHAQPVRIEYRKELAVELLCRGEDDDFEEARGELRALLALPAVTPIDRVDQRHAHRLLESPPDDVCWYTRESLEAAR
jgi:tetratricopeptide (TPR) repeat protein